MPPTRKLSRSKQQTEPADNESSDKAEEQAAERNESISNDGDVTDQPDDGPAAAASSDGKPADESSAGDDEDKSKLRRGRPRRSTANSSQLANDLNEATNDKGREDLVSSPTRRAPLSPDKKESDIKLRRRDKLRGTERYSPEIHEPVRRSKRPVQFPSTSSNSSQNKYINFEGVDDEQSFSSQNSAASSQMLHTKKMLLKRSATTMQDEQNTTATNESKTYLVNLKKEENEVILVMPDGRTLKIEKQMQKKMKTGKRGDDDYELSSDDALDDDDDMDYEESGKPNKATKRKSTSKNPRSSKATKCEAVDLDDIVPSKAVATGIKMTKQIRKATKQQLMSNKLGGDETRTTRITTPTGSGKTVTFITTPKSVTVTPTNTYLKNANTYVKRNYGSNAKYLNEIPDLNECTLEEVNPDYEILPDQILLINSDLPLEHSLNADHQGGTFLFSQIISAMGDFKCLLCSAAKANTFKDENELVEHYKQFHEVEVEQQNAKFSEDTVFVCLPKSIIGQIGSEEGTDQGLVLDAPCQYCGDEQKLATVNDMREHYKLSHSKEIKIVEQEEILEMYEVLFCSICQLASKDFKLHYKHMKDEHQMQIYICKQCPFFSKVAQRLVTHYRAKHLMSNKSQNLQCSFCNGILIGTDRMNKHIMTSHCVQTGQNEYSCMLCLQPCEKSDQLLAHSYQCQRKFNESLALSHKQEKLPLTEQVRLAEQHAAQQENAGLIDRAGEKFVCYLCDKQFASETLVNLHLNHVHTKWTSTVVVNDTFLMVQHKDGKTDLMPNKAGAKAEPEQINVNDLPTNREVEEIGAKTQFGYYCSKCECVINIYQLFYLHMHNFHKMTKQFECKITSCKKTFKTHESFKEHIDQTKHPQKSVIEDPLLAIACHNCDSYFIDDKDIETHLLSDEHYSKVIKNQDRSSLKAEARNYKCKTCHTWFGLLDSFIYHMEHESHKHGCPHCGLHFALPSSRRTHIQSTHSDRADICELCSEKQGTKERLFAHLVTHNLVFECNKCMRKFYQREQLNNHMETHEEPLACPWPKCERKVNRQALSNHIRQHKVDSSLKCYACDKLFNTKAQLLAHVEVHNTAEQNAKQILATANNNVAKVGRVAPIGQTKPRTGQIQVNTTPSVQQPVETTLISITTAPSANKQRTYGNRSLSNSANKLNSAAGKQVAPVAAKSAGAPKLSCYTCNQIFANHAELSEHKCSIPVVTITKNEISNMLNNKQIDLNDNNQNEQHQLIFTAEKLNGNETSPCYIMTDGSQLLDSSVKHVILQQQSTANHAGLEESKSKKIITVPSVSSTSSSHNRFMESNKKTYDFQNRAKKTYSSLKNKQTNATAPTTGQLLNDPLKSNLVDSGQQQQQQQIYIETQSPINQQTQLILTDAGQLAQLNSGGNIELDSNTAATIQALIQDNQIIQTGNEVLQIPLDQHSVIMQEQQQIVVTTTANSVNSSTAGSQLMDQAVLNQQQMVVATTQEQTAAEQQIAADTNQYIMIQQPDGQVVQICIPEGMDVDEVIKNLNFTWQGGDEQTVQVAGDQTAQFLDSQQILEQQQLIADQQNQLIAAEQQAAVQQTGLDQSTLEQLQSGEQQVIYLPVNEDGACVLDAESLQAMLATNGEIPIIVSSSN